MSGTLFTPPRFIPVNGSGRPYPGAKLYFYEAGTTTLATVYTTSALDVEASNPLTASASGMFDAVYLNPSATYNYKAVLKNSAGSQLWSEDDIPASYQQFKRTQPEISAGVTPSNYDYEPGDSRRYATLADWALVGGSLRLVGTNTTSSSVTLVEGSTVDATGATLTLTGGARIVMTNSTAWKGGAVLGPGATYSASNHAFYCSGTRNGASVAPTYKTQIRIDDVRVSGFGDSAIYLAYVEYAWIRGCLLENLGYAGVQALSCNSIEVDGNTIETLTGESGSGELNAYGVTFTADSSSTDFVRDPHSSYCRAVNNTAVGIPTWHAFDTHGGQYCEFIGNTIINCRRGVILTNRTHYGAKFCRAEGNTYINTFAESAANSNASEKRSTAFWDIGASSSLQNEYNSIKNNYIYQAGESSSATAAIITQYTQRGEVSGNTLVGCYTCAIACQDYTEWYTFDNNRVVDVRSIGISGGGNTDNPQCFRFFNAAAGANFNEIAVTNNVFLRHDGALDNFVGEVGFLIDNTASKSAFFSNNAFSDIDTPWSYSGDTTGFTGDVELSFTGTLTGMSATTTGTVTYARHGRVVSLTFPSIEGTSNATTMTLTGLPSHLIPATTKTVVTRAKDSGTVCFAVASIAASTGVITYTKDVTGGSWTNTGTKGVPVSTLTYTID